MTADDGLRLAWIRVGSMCGIGSMVAYVCAAFVPLPDTLGYAAAFAFGPLLSIASVGLYHSLARFRIGPSLQIATGLAIAAGVTVLLMLTTQQAIFSVVQSSTQGDGDVAALQTYRAIRSGLNAVHFGLDVAWDVLISAAVILFGANMLRDPRFGRVIGAVGMLLGALLLGFNLYYFPTPPASASSIDWGPLVALWLASAFVLAFRTRTWTAPVDCPEPRSATMVSPS